MSALERARHTFSKALALVILHRKYAWALTFENVHGKGREGIKVDHNNNNNNNIYYCYYYYIFINDNDNDNQIAPQSLSLLSRMESAHHYNDSSNIGIIIIYIITKIIII